MTVSDHSTGEDAMTMAFGTAQKCMGNKRLCEAIIRSIPALTTHPLMDYITHRGFHDF